VLKKQEEDLSMYQIKYTVLEKIRPLIEQATELEKAMHRAR